MRSGGDVVLTLAILWGCSPDDGAPIAVQDALSVDVGSAIEVRGWQPVEQSDGTAIAASGVSVVIGTDGAIRASSGDGSVALRVDRPGQVAIALGEVRHGPVDVMGGVLRRVEIHRPGLTEWWHGGERGVEQGFELASGDGRVDLAIDAPVTVAASGRSARFGGLWYGDLRAWDANGRTLPARLLPTAGGLQIAVDVADAAWPVTVDPVIAADSWGAAAPHAGEDFGNALAGVGDVNGDGYEDAVVGEQRFPSSAVDAGAAYLFLGGPDGLADTAAFAIEDAVANDYLGHAVSPAGDADGDGFADFIVGAPGAGFTGQVRLYRGGPGLPARDKTMSGAVGSNFGMAIGCVGDVDTDGLSEIVVGAPYDSTDGSGVGRAFVFEPGGPTGAVPLQTIAAPSAITDGNFGYSVAGVGDVDGDGLPDIAFGQPRWNQGPSDEGRVEIWRGGATFTRWRSVTGGAGGRRFGWSVIGVGDLNADGFSDFVVSGDPTVNGRGGIWGAFSGGAAIAPIGSLIVGGSNEAVGAVLGRLGDTNGDGYADFVVTSMPGSSGMTHVYFGANAGLGSFVPGPTFSAGASPTAFGSGLGGGDFNGDGLGDMLVGEQWAGVGGVAHLYPGARPAPQPIAPRSGPVDYGRALAIVDTDGNGIGDVFTGAPMSNQAFRASGGGANLGADAAIAVPSGALRWGKQLSSAGDVDGDGFEDLLVGAPRTSDPETFEGMVQLIFGGAAGGLTAGPTFELDTPNAQLGDRWGTASVGDLDRDGCGDFAISGSWSASFMGPGVVAAYHGCSPTEWSRWTGVDPVGRLGSALAAGDLDRDGFDDLVVGRAGGSGFDVYKGSASGFAVNPAPYPLPAGANFGAALAVCDLNGDGYDDVAVGGPLYGNGQAGEGSVHVFVGGPGPLTPGLVLPESDVTGQGTGSALACGDVDGDGFADLIVGEPAGGMPGLAARVSVFRGGAGGVAAVSWFRVNGPALSEFARSLAVGDINGDGLADVLIGDRTHQQVAVLISGLQDLGAAGVIGAPLALTARHADGRRIAVGMVGDLDGFVVKGIARGPYGRRRVRLAVEVKPVAVPFDGQGLARTDYGLVGRSGLAMNRSITGLASDAAFHWRGRFEYDPTSDPPSPFTPWVYGDVDDPTGTHLITGCIDTDGDRICDVRDPDDDNDGRVDGLDAAPLNPSVCADTDNDGCDDCAVSTYDPRNDGVDLDADGLCDAHDACQGDNASGDTDGDGICNDLDPDDDGDGRVDGEDSASLNPRICADTDHDGCDDCAVSTYDPANDGPDLDSDGVCDAGDDDLDGDGIPNAVEDAVDVNGDAVPDLDVDGDGIPNARDLDSDGAGASDVDEGLGDRDNDGIPNAYDPVDDPPDTDTAVDTDTDTAVDTDTDTDATDTDLSESNSWLTGGGCDTGAIGASWVLILAGLAVGRRRRR